MNANIDADTKPATFGAYVTTNFGTGRIGQITMEKDSRVQIILDNGGIVWLERSDFRVID